MSDVGYCMECGLSDVELEALKAENQRLREALEEMCDHFGAQWDDLPSAIRKALQESGDE